MKKIIFLFFLFVFIPFSFLCAQQAKTGTVTIKGQVIDSLTLETLPYSTLRVIPANDPSSILQAIASDEKGNFSFTLNESGEYQVLADYIGKKQLIRSFTVGEEKMIDLGKLEMSDDNLLTEVTVTALKPLVKVDLDKITYNIQEDPESQTNNVLDMLRKVPLITVDGEENISLKGSENYKIYLNGKPSNMISNNPKEVLRSMPANTIKDIEIITDPGAKYDAEGVVGIINIITYTNTSMGGYTATLNAGADSRGGVYGGTYVMFKYGKIGFTGNYNYYNWKMPESTFGSTTENFVNNDNKYLFQDGVRKYKGDGQNGSGELSYEIDTLNLINVGFSRYVGSNKYTSNIFLESLNADRELQYSYRNRGLNNKNEYGGTNVNVDYQRTFSGVPDRLMTASYLYSYSPSNSRNENLITNEGENLPEYIELGQIKQWTDANTKEHTFQLDYTTPIKKYIRWKQG
ncbi:MAG: carboxypeptidase-like regulatory domain-containing protein [Candidatus Azobacteroides sp.]|nr:carboxypeptidase-like regulatory domain-containing protein [Candidatus Azobacteroides sp.]